MAFSSPLTMPDNQATPSAKMIAVPMEPCCLDPANWTGVIQMELGGLLYEANFANDDPAEFDENIEKLYQQIRRKCARYVLEATWNVQGVVT